MRNPRSQLINSRSIAVLSLVVSVPAIVGVLVVEIGILAVIVHFPLAYGLLVWVSGLLMLSLSFGFESMLASPKPPATAPSVLKWVRRRTVYISSLILFGMFLVATYFAYVWPKTHWEDVATYFLVSVLIIECGVFAIAGGLVLAAGIDAVGVAIRRIKAWNRPLLEAWTDDEIRSAIDSRLHFGRWPDPRNVELSALKLDYLIAASRENATRSVLFGQILLLIGGAFLSTSVVPLVSDALSFLGTVAQAIGRPPLDLSGLKLDSGTFASVMLAGVSLVVGLVGLLLALVGSGRWQRRTELYSLERGEFIARSE